MESLLREQPIPAGVGGGTKSSCCSDSTYGVLIQYCVVQKEAFVFAGDEETDSLRAGRPVSERVAICLVTNAGKSASDHVVWASVSGGGPQDSSITAVQTS
jgi:hypothetical protein